MNIELCFFFVAFVSTTVVSLKLENPNARPIARNSHPFLLSIWVKGDSVPWCGASLITDPWNKTSSRFVLTAAHCVCNEYGYTYRIYAGQHLERSQWYVYRDLIPSKTICHPVPSNGYMNQYDIALIMVDPPFPYDNRNSIAPIDFQTDMSLCKTYTIVGWGAKSTSPSTYPKEAQALLVNRTTQPLCWELTKMFDFRKLLCFMSDSGSVCPGDSGSPFYCTINNRLTLAAIQSFLAVRGNKICTLNARAYGTRVSTYSAWITEQMRRFNEADVRSKKKAMTRKAPPAPVKGRQRTTARRIQPAKPIRPQNHFLMPAVAGRNPNRQWSGFSQGQSGKSGQRGKG